MAINTSASAVLKFANLQIAAEAFLADATGTLLIQNREDKKKALMDLLENGNKHASAFPKLLAKDFADHWKVLAQKPNTGTGFSGTVFECILDDPANGFKVGETVVSFRSTEFIDDAVRDNQATNKMEISEFGFAFGQIADMEDWYRQLNRPGGELAGKNFYVTGYSLGGHLATAFYRLRRESGAGDRILGAVTFNGAGIGNVKDGKLQGRIARFDELRQNAASLIHFDNPALQAIFARMRTTFDGSRPLSDDSYADFKLAIGRELDAATANDVRGCTLLLKALDRIRDISVEAMRVNGENGQGGAHGRARSKAGCRADSIEFGNRQGEC